ncbi:MAG: CMP-N,N'-diacetyllegionaminic acid synthase [Candidatus Marinamargulisbacteria bacterium]|jgi:CMP-N,N'-diacetyllegionaminic acid synthase
MSTTVISIIPARSGSKGLPNKNIVPLGRHPLIAYSILASRLSNLISKTFVSTDGQEIADIAKSYKAAVPFLRPSDISTDTSTDLEMVLHFLDWYEAETSKQPDFLIHLRPTTPLRDSAIIDQAIQCIQDSPEATALRSVTELPESPHKMFEIKDGFLQGLFPEDPRPEYYNLPRQSFDPVYKPNGYVDILKPSVVRETGTLHGAKMLAFTTQETVEVDTQAELDYIAFQLQTTTIDIKEHLQ